MKNDPQAKLKKMCRNCDWENYYCEECGECFDDCCCKNDDWPKRYDDNYSSVCKKCSRHLEDCTCCDSETNQRKIGMNPIMAHKFVCDPKSPGGEQLLIVTRFIPNGDPGVIFTNHDITLQSYYNSASINLCGIQLSPKILRQLADELETANQEAIVRLNTGCDRCGTKD